ncbi:MAG: hypothetical protein M3N68_08740 [Actinomycetota bacterium]|nr:hypothetical protein [Actinomycetota bacterium]
MDLDAMERSGLLRVVSDHAEVASMKDHYASIRQLLDEFRPRRIVIDNLSALERVTTQRGLRDFIIGLTSFLRQHDVSSLFTSATTSLLGTESVTESLASALTDAIALLRYVGWRGPCAGRSPCSRVRGSAHDGRIHEFTSTTADSTSASPSPASRASWPDPSPSRRRPPEA